MKAVLYARVSSKDQHTIPAQLADCRAYCERQGWSVVAEFSEKESGKRDTRPQREALLEFTRKRRVDVVIVWKLDRWSRRMADCVLTIDQLIKSGVGFVAVTQQLDFTTPAGRLMANVLACFAEFEREQIHERSIAGMKRYRANPDNKPWGRPATAKAKRARVELLRMNGLSHNKIAAELGISRSSVIRILREARSVQS